MLAQRPKDLRSTKRFYHPSSCPFYNLVKGPLGALPGRLKRQRGWRRVVASSQERIYAIRRQPNDC
jgi:hypothetical protein